MSTKQYTNYELADKEFNKYLNCLENAKQGIIENDKKKVEHWLMVSRMALKQSANYRNRKR